MKRNNFTEKIGKEVSKTWNFVKMLVFIFLELAIIVGAIMLDLTVEVAVLVTNIVTFILALVSYKTFAKVMTSAAHDQIQNNLREQSLRDRISALEDEKKRLKDQLETSDQTRRFFNEISFGTKLELLEVASSGYVVKEEDMEDVQRISGMKELIPSTFGQGVQRHTNKLKSLFTGENPDDMEVSEKRSMLYIEKSYNKYSIGINLDNVRYAIDRHSGKIYLSGLDIVKLHNTSAELSRSSNDISHCWVLSETNDGDRRICRDKKYDQLEAAYRRYQENSVRGVVESEISAKCQQYTKGIRESLSARYRNLEFVEANQRGNYNLTWLSLRMAGGEQEVMRIATDMVIGLQMLEESNKVDKSITSYLN